jgi:hypothetical protein
MSFNRLKNDKCTYSQELKQSTSPLDYRLYCGAFHNPRSCHNNNCAPVPKTGPLWNLYSGDITNCVPPPDLITLESDLRGQMRLSSLCPSAKFQSGEQLKYFQRKCQPLPPEACSHITTNMKYVHGTAFNPKPHATCHY